MRPITIHVSCDKTHNSPWEVYQYVAGKKIRLGRTKTKKEAVAKAAAYQEQINRRGTETVTLTVAQIDEYLRAKAALGDRSLDEVVKLFLSAGQRPSVSLKKAAADFMSAIEARGLQDCSVRDYRGKIDFLVSTYPDQTVEFFASPPGESGQPFVDFVMNASSNNQTRKHYRTKLGTFLRWCETRNWISKHPGVWVEIGQVQRDPPAVYTPDDTAKLLDGFERLCPRLVPFITLQAFGALRPFEAMRQTAERLYFEEKKLLISHHKRGADPTQTRTVEDPPETLWTWLSPLRGASGLIDSRDCYQQIDRIPEGASNSNVKLHFESDLDYQQQAIAAVADLFRGQEICRTEFTVTRANELALESPDAKGIGNRLTLLDEEVLSNLAEIQLRHGLRPSGALASGDFTVEMETGTGKTYVYLRTVFELHKLYGFTKFVIVVPSVAIKEGVFKTLQIRFQTGAI